MTGMTGRERFLTAIACGRPRDAVPVWELEFHMWERYCAKLPFIIGDDFVRLTSAEQERALAQDAELMVEVALHLGYSAVTCIGGYWEAAPGIPAYLWLPGDAPLRLLSRLRDATEDRLALVFFACGTIAAPLWDHVEFSYRLYDAPQDIDEMARRTLDAGILVSSTRYPHTTVNPAQSFGEVDALL